MSMIDAPPLQNTPRTEAGTQEVLRGGTLGGVRRNGLGQDGLDRVGVDRQVQLRSFLILFQPLSASANIKRVGGKGLGG